MMEMIRNPQQLSEVVKRSLQNVKIVDMHTHLFPSSYQKLCLYGIDELLNYHYLISEALRQTDMAYEQFWGLAREKQAELIWDVLFVQSSPLSEATQGVVTILEALQIDYHTRDLNKIRQQFAELTRQEDYLDRIMSLAQVEAIVMTNDVFNAEELTYMKTAKQDSRFLHSLRLDALFTNWEAAVQQVNSFGYPLESELSALAIAQLTDYLRKWIEQLRPVYIAVSLPPDFRYPDGRDTDRLLEELILPLCREYNLPLALMIGAKRKVNPALRLAGDAVGQSNLEMLRNLCLRHPSNKFLVTALSRENQYELTVLARKFRNVMLFGCWWFLNTPAFVEEMTRMRLELLGTSFIPQHSDSRVFEHLIYKWKHSLASIEKVLLERYVDTLNKGWMFTAQEIERDVSRMFRDNFITFSSAKAIEETDNFNQKG